MANGSGRSGRRWLANGGAAVVVAVIAACGGSNHGGGGDDAGGGGSGSGGSTPHLTVTAARTAIELRPMLPGQLAVSIDRDGFAGDVTLGLAALPAGVTAPEVTIPAGATSATLAFTTSLAALEGAFHTQIVAHGAGAADGAAELQIAVALGEFDTASSGALGLATGDRHAFNPALTPIRFAVTGAQLAATPQIYARHNDAVVPAAAISVDAQGITLAATLIDGPNHFTVTARDTTGATLVGDATLWSGGNQLAVHVVDAGGQDVSGAKVELALGDDRSVVATATTAAGIASFTAIPTRTIAIRATEGDRIGFAAITGDATSVTVKLTAFGAPSPIDNNDFSQGIAGWELGTAPAAVAPHVEGPLGTPIPFGAAIPRASRRTGRALALPAPRPGVAADGDFDLQVNTLGEGLQQVSRTFAIPSGATAIKVRYRFITSEVPGGFFGTEFNDYFTISIRTSSGAAITDGNSMNALGLQAFDTAGATGWYVASLGVAAPTSLTRELVLPLTAADAGSVEVTAGVANVADGLFDSMVVIDAVVAEKLVVKAKPEAACPNQTIAFTAETKATGTITWTGADDPTTGTGAAFSGRFANPGQHQIRATQVTDAGTLTGEKTVKIAEASGTAWVARFPGSTSTADLSAGFRTSAVNFLGALSAAGATTSIAATLRPAQRAYLMHYAYLIAHGTDATTVPAMDGVDICWAHYKTNGDLDTAAATAAASAMVTAYGIVHAPALTSRHTEGNAIDVTISWTGNLTINNASGTPVTITSTPRTGDNADLWALGATYGAVKLPSDPPHWSTDGH